MLNNPIARREFLGTLRRRRATVAMVATAVLFTVLVVLRWPTDAHVDLSGAQSRQVFRLFGYGLMTCLLLLSPAFPATSIVREKQQGTLVLLLNSRMNSWSIYGGKLVGHIGFVALLVLMSLPAAAACYAMGGVSLVSELLFLYGILGLLALQCTALALLVSTCANSTESALRITYGCVLLVSVISLGPHYFLQGTGGLKANCADWCRCLSPIPAVMHVFDQGGVGAQGIVSSADVAVRHVILAALSTALFALLTIARLNHTIFDRSRSQGVITDERSTLVRSLRWMFFVVDPQRRKPGIGPLTNPVMVKEFRCRRFGRMHWMLRLAAASALISLGLTYVAAMGTMDWGPETIGGIMVLLQAALIVLVTPSLAAGLISAEIESGGWQLLQMTPLSASKILRGKLASVVWPVLLILVSTLPGYVVMVYIQPEMWLQVRQVLVCLAFTALLSISLSFAASSLFSRTAMATTVAYSTLGVFCGGTMLIWLLRDSPFGHATVQWALTTNPIAPALTVIRMPGFTQYSLIPANWWFVAFASALSAAIVLLRTRRLTRPQ